MPDSRDEMIRQWNEVVEGGSRDIVEAVANMILDQVHAKINDEDLRIQEAGWTPQTGAERYLEGRLKDDDYREAYEAALAVQPDGLFPILSHGDWGTNAQMIRDACVPLGYLSKDRRTLDPTYGYGNFWTLWKPDNLIASDLDPKKSPIGEAVDATDLPHDDESFDDVVIDGPYRLNGTADIPFDERYGTEEYKHPRQRHRLIMEMMTEGTRVLRRGGHLLVKCQAQISNQQFWHQPHIFISHAGGLDLGLVDELQYPSYRPQPKRSTCTECGQKIMMGKDRVWRSCKRTIAEAQKAVCEASTEEVDQEHQAGPLEQEHAHRNFSSLLVFRKG